MRAHREMDAQCDKQHGKACRSNVAHRVFCKKGKRSPYSITERWVLELIPVLAVSLQVTRIINLTVDCHYFPPGLQLPPQPL